MSTVTKSPKIDMFGVNLKRLLAMLRSQSGVFPIELNEVALLVQTPYSLTRTARTDELLAKYPLNDYEGAVKRSVDMWNRLESESVQSRLYLTNRLMEDNSGKLVRKLVTSNGDHEVWLPKAYLDMFGLELSDLQSWLFESIPYYEQDIEYSPVRIAIKERHTSGYSMPYVNIQERIFK